MKGHKWVSNSQEVLEAIHEQEHSAEFKRLDLYNSELPPQRALGMKLCVASDPFFFGVDHEARPPTRRGILSLVSSVFDPLGSLAPFVLLAKEILQSLCRIKLAWGDDEMPTEYRSSWSKWRDDLPKLSSFSVTRSVLPESWSCSLQPATSFF